MGLEESDGVWVMDWGFLRVQKMARIQLNKFGFLMSVRYTVLFFTALEGITIVFYFGHCIFWSSKVIVIDTLS